MQAGRRSLHTVKHPSQPHAGTADPAKGGTADPAKGGTADPAKDGTAGRMLPSEPTAGARQALRALVAAPDGMFGRLLLARLTGQCADGVFQASLAGAVLFNPERAATSEQIAVALAVLLIPYSLVGPFAGTLLDRWSRQRVLLSADLARALLVAVVAAEIGAGVDGPLLYGTALVTISVNRFFLSGLSAALPGIVPAPTLVTANAVSGTLGTAAATLGAAIALGLRAAVGAGDRGYAVVALSAALGYLASAAAISRFHRRRLGPAGADRDRRESVRDVVAGLVGGLRHLRERPAAAAALGAMAGHRLCYGMTTVMAVLLYRNYFSGDRIFRSGLAGLSQLIASGAAGALVAAVLTPSVAARLGARAWLALLVAASGLVEVALGLSFTMPALLVAGFLLGFAAQGVKITVDTTCQREVDDAFRGRVFAVYDMLFNVMYVVAAAAATVALPASGRSPGMVIGVGIGYLLIAVGSLAWATVQISASDTP